jgi:hypothetical protein
LPPDGIDWEEIDPRENNSELKGIKVTVTFEATRREE